MVDEAVNGRGMPNGEECKRGAWVHGEEYRSHNPAHHHIRISDRLQGFVFAKGKPNGKDEQTAIEKRHPVVRALSFVDADRNLGRFHHRDGDRDPKMQFAHLFYGELTREKEGERGKRKERQNPQQVGQVEKPADVLLREVVVKEFTLLVLRIAERLI